MTETSSLIGKALEQIAGVSLLCDHDMRVVLASPGCSELLGHEVRTGESAIKLLCGDREHKPIAQALAKGHAAKGQIVRFRTVVDDKNRRKETRKFAIEVSATPLTVAVGNRASSASGWLLRLATAETEATVGSHTALGDQVVTFHGMTTADPAMKRMFHVMQRAATRSVPVLVRGPSGSGKELVAQAIHNLSPRKRGPFRAVNCAALPAELLESELFGHVKGAFTGAVKDHLGIFRAASGGTLFLDEIAEMPLPLQAKLLRVLETKTVLPVGATTAVPIDVRIVSATHQPLREAVRVGRFRADLMFRLRVVPIFLPPLQQRTGDVALLVSRFVTELNAEGLTEGSRVVDRVAKSAMARLEAYHWPGNVRELRNVLEYAYVIGEGPTIVEADLPPELFELEPNEPHPQFGNSGGQDVAAALAQAGGNRARAAAMLGISRVTLWRKMVALGLAESKAR